MSTSEIIILVSQIYILQQIYNWFNMTIFLRCFKMVKSLSLPFQGSDFNLLDNLNVNLGGAQVQSPSE